LVRMDQVIERKSKLVKIVGESVEIMGRAKFRVSARVEEKKDRKFKSGGRGKLAEEEKGKSLSKRY